MNYYFDSCIWIDYFENRKNLFGVNLGNPVAKLIHKIIKNKHKIIYSKLTEKELSLKINIEDEITLLYKIGILQKVEISQEQITEAEIISQQRNLGFNDVLHAIIARENNAILISRDAHFLKLKDLVKIRRPKELI